MARKTLTDRRKETQQELKAIHEKMAKLDRETSERIGRLAIKTGFADLGLTDDQIKAVFQAAIAEHRKGEKS
ncbi:TraC family protein [Rhizobium binxianense]